MTPGVSEGKSCPERVNEVLNRYSKCIGNTLKIIPSSLHYSKNLGHPTCRFVLSFARRLRVRYSLTATQSGSRRHGYCDNLEHSIPNMRRFLCSIGTLPAVQHCSLHHRLSKKSLVFAVPGFTVVYLYPTPPQTWRNVTPGSLPRRGVAHCTGDFRHSRGKI